MVHKLCSQDFLTRSELMKHIKAGCKQEEAQTETVKHMPVPPSDALTAAEVAGEVPHPTPDITHLYPNTDLLMAAFHEMKDADSRAGIMQVIQDPLINQTIKQEVLRLCFMKVADGDARNIVRTKLGLL